MTPKGPSLKKSAPSVPLSWGEADGQTEAGGLAGGAMLLCASAYTTAAEMLARWCAKNELGGVRAVPYWVES